LKPISNIYGSDDFKNGENAEQFNQEIEFIRNQVKIYLNFE
jgi:hypothetical protein